MTKTRILINGYGRIGRLLHRVILADTESRLDVVAVNSRADAQSHAHLLKHDSTYGTLREQVSFENNYLSVNGDKIKVFVDRNPGDIDLTKENIDIVAECTGKFKDRESCLLQLNSGAKKVVISAPGQDEDISIVMGINESDYKPSKHNIISNASCTTNCLVPVLKVINEEFGITSAQMTTIHAITKSQNIIDGSHSKCMRRARSAVDSIIPTTTGAAKAVIKFFPELEGKFGALCVRVPFTTVSMIDLVVNLKKRVDEETINKAFELASKSELKGILGISYEPLVSVDYKGENRSAVVDGLSTNVVNNTTAKIIAWYDNEWGYTRRLYDLITMVGTKKN